jgi:hypothetical protein
MMNATEIHKMKASIERSETIVIVLQWATRKQHAEDKAAICGFINRANDLKSRTRVSGFIWLAM